MNRYTTKSKCGCGKATSVLAERVHAEWKFAGAIRGVFVGERGAVYYGALLGWDDSALLVECRGCRKLRVAGKVYGKVRVDKKCDARCQSATGHSCECSCGGKNHGAAHS